MISPTRRPLPDNTQHSQETDVHAPGETGICNHTKRAASAPRLRPHSHRDLFPVLKPHHVLTRMDEWLWSCIVPHFLNFGCNCRRVPCSAILTFGRFRYSMVGWPSRPSVRLTDLQTGTSAGNGIPVSWSSKLQPLFLPLHRVCHYFLCFYFTNTDLLLKIQWKISVL